MRANLRKQILQVPNLRMYPRGRPHMRQRLCCCTLNFAGRSDFTILDILAILNPYSLTKGIPNNSNKFLPSSSVFAVVTMTT